MDFPASSPVSSTRLHARRSSQGSPTSSESRAFGKTARSRRSSAQRHKLYTGARPHMPPSLNLLQSEGRVRVATLQELHAQLDIRDELAKRDATEAKALADMRVGLARLHEQWTALERQMLDLYPNLSNIVIGGDAKGKGKEIEMRQNEHDIEEDPCSSSETTPTKSVFAPGSTTPRILITPAPVLTPSPGTQYRSLQPPSSLSVM